MDTNYWSRLTDTERNMCFGEVSHLMYQGKTAWNIAGCLEQYWKLDLSTKVAEICNNSNNMRRIYRGHRHRPNVVTDMYLFGHVERKADAYPAIIVLSANGSVAKRLASLLSCHESLKLPGFEVLHLEVKVELLAGRIDHQAWLNAVRSSSSVPGELARDILDETNRRKPRHFEPRLHSDVVSDGDSHEHAMLDDGEGFRQDSTFVQEHYLNSQSSRSSSPGGSVFDYPASQSTHSNRTSFSTLNAWRPRLDGESLQGAKSAPTFDTEPLCGSCVVTSQLPVDPSSSRQQCTIGGVIVLGGKFYGMTVAHPFFKRNAPLNSDSDSTSLTGSDAGQEDEHESDSHSDGEDSLNRISSLSRSRCEIYLEDLIDSDNIQRVPKATLVSAIGMTSRYSLTESFNARRSLSTKYWSSELDWALVRLSTRRFRGPNRIYTSLGTITPSMIRRTQDLKQADVIVASGVSGIIYTQLQSSVAQIVFPWSNKMQEVWKVECVCSKFLLISCLLLHC
jgi:hypothetical protein